jgi:hypothetical protein
MTYAVPQPLDGYRRLNEVELALLDAIKKVERDVIADLWRMVRDADTTDREHDPAFDSHESGVYVDPRWLDVARLHLQEGISALVRSVARPADPYASSPTYEVNVRDVE